MCNVAKLHDKGIYKTMFPLTQKTAIIDNKTTLIIKNKQYPKYIMYGELFISNKLSKNIKINAATDISSIMTHIITPIRIKTPIMITPKKINKISSKSPKSKHKKKSKKKYMYKKK